jgi:hypothetical protein
MSFVEFSNIPALPSQAMTQNQSREMSSESASPESTRDGRTGVHRSSKNRWIDDSGFAGVKSVVRISHHPAMSQIAPFQLMKGAS